MLFLILITLLSLVLNIYSFYNGSMVRWSRKDNYPMMHLFIKLAMYGLIFEFSHNHSTTKLVEGLYMN